MAMDAGVHSEIPRSRTAEDLEVARLIAETKGVSSFPASIIPGLRLVED